MITADVPQRKRTKERAGRSTSWNQDGREKYQVKESEEELKHLLMKVKLESEKVGLKFSIQKIKIMACSPITSWQIEGETVADYFLGLQNHFRW